MNRLSEYFKSLSMLSVATLLLGMGQQPKMTSLELASQDSSPTTGIKVPYAAPQANSKIIGYPGFGIDPAVIDAINKVFRANKDIPKVMTAPAQTTNATAACTDCNTAAATKIVSDIRYEQCSANRNDYLESTIEKTSGKNTILGQLARLPLKQDTIIKPSCIQRSLQSTKLLYNFRSCSGTGYSSPRIRPCASESYVKLVSNSFDMVSRCMKDYMSPGASADIQKRDIMAAYAMLNHESSMHVNAVSSTLAGGVGQFTEPAIDEVNRSLSTLRGYLDSHNSNQCADLSKEFLAGTPPMESGARKACGRISIEQGNPVKNMIYSFAALRNAGQYLSKYVLEDDVYSQYFALSASDKAELKRSLMTWSHNTGLAGLTGPMYSLLKNQYSKSKKVTNVQTFLAQLKTYSKTHPFRTRGYNPSRARLNEMAGYFSNIQNDIKVIQANVGGSCLN